MALPCSEAFPTALDRRGWAFHASCETHALPGIRDALQVGPQCPQQSMSFAPDIMKAMFGVTDTLAPEPMQEDCLVLNVFTPGSWRQGNGR